MTNFFLAAPARAPATPTPIARTIPRHDAAAEAATGSVAQVDDAGQRVGRVNRTASRLSASALRTPDRGRRILFHARCAAQPQILEQHSLLSSQKPQLQPAEDVIHNRLGEADVGIAGPAAGLEARVRKFFAE